MTMKRRRAARGSGEQLREEILVAAEALLVSLGDENAMSIRAVADAVGVTPPSIYLHFADKEQLVLAVCEHQFEQLSQVLDEAAEQAQDPVHDLWLRGRAYVNYGLEHPEAYRIMFMGHPRSAQDLARSTMTRPFTAIVETVQRAIDAKMLRKDLNPLMVATMLWSNGHGITSLLISKPTFPWPDRDVLIDEVLEQSLRGLTTN